MEGGGFFFAEGAEFACAAFNGGGWHVVGKSGGTGAGADGIGKNVEITERAGLDKTHGGGVVVFGFAGETGDDVGADGGVGQLFLDEVDAAGVVFGAIPAVHGGEDFVGGGLERHMEMFREAWRGCEERDEIAGDVEWFDGAEAEARDGRVIENLAEEIEKIVARREIAAPGTEVDAAEDDLFVACGRKIADFGDDGCGREAAAFSANERDDAECAAVVATVLDFESGAGVVGFATEDRGDEDVVLIEDVADEDGGGIGRRPQIAAR